MKQNEIYQRLNNPNVVKVYVNMIKTSPESVVRELRKNIELQASEHPKYEMLENLFIERLGE